MVPNNTNLTGTFRVAKDRKVNGTLSLAGLDTSLCLWDDNPFDLFDVGQLLGTGITGVLDDSTKVSLIECRVSGKYRNNWTSYSCKLFPHYVVIGDQWFSDEGRDVHEISFTFDDAKVLFLDRSPVSSIGRCISVYSDQRGNVFVKLKFDSKISIIEALSRMDRVLQFFELMVGRAQNALEINIFPGTPTESAPSEVHVNNTKHQHSNEKYKPGFGNILIRPVQDSKVFSSVLEAWLARDEKRQKWRTARERLSSSWLSNSWGKRGYDHDRLIRAANVFDLLPDDEFGDNEPLSQELEAAVKGAREIFLGLDESDDRDIVLGTLGRVGERKLKKKIRRRAESIAEGIGHLIPEFELVINKAVDCRNLYVHGSDKRGVTPKLCDSCVVFLADTLEFIFFASDLADAGWDIAGWCQKPSPYGHPFADYLFLYERSLDRLKELDPKTGQ